MHHGRWLELDIDTASRGVFDGPFGLVVEVIVLQAVAGRSHRAQGGLNGHGTLPFDRRTWPRSTRRTMEGGIAWMPEKRGRERVCACAFASECGKVSAGQARNVCSERNVLAF